VDHSVQRSLLVGMVLLEVALVAASTWQLHSHLNELIEESLYRVHHAVTGPMLSLLLTEALRILGAFIALNLVALLVAEGIWTLHKGRVVKAFAQLIEKTRHLDFSGDAEADRDHEVLELALAWREGERARFASIRERVAKLRELASAGRDPEEVKTSVRSLGAHLRSQRNPAAKED
jgi:hypothetical protein